MKVRRDLPALWGYRGEQGSERFRTILKYPAAADRATTPFGDNDTALKKDEQRALLEAISYADATPSLAQAIRMKRLSQEGKLSGRVVESIMAEEKPNQREKINIRYEDARKYIPSGVPYHKTGEYILKALEYYQRYREHQREKDRNDAR